MASHVLGNPDGPPPPSRNELLLREAVDRLRRELEEYRADNARLRQAHEMHEANHARIVERAQAQLREAREVMRRGAEALAAYDKAEGGK